MKNKVFLLFIALCMAVGMMAQSASSRKGEKVHLQGIAFWNKGDFKQAAKCYEKAADQGYPEGMFMLHVCYVEGLGVPKNVQKSNYWMEQAAQCGHLVSQKSLGKKYMDGTDVEKDLQKAAYWYEKAANQGDEEAMKKLTELKAQGINVPSAKPLTTTVATTHTTSKTPGEKEYQQAEKQWRDDKRVKYYEKAANKGYAEAQYWLGWCYRQGKGVGKNDTKAAYWVEKAAQQGHVGAMTQIGYCYNEGVGVKQDYQKSHYWSEKAALAGNKVAQYNYAEDFELGHGVEKNKEKAIYWYRKAADQNLEPAKKKWDELTQSADYLYDKGYDLHYDGWWGGKGDSCLVKAVPYFMKAANMGQFMAQYWLGLYYEKGKGGLPQDDKKAAYWYEKSAMQGELSAQYKIGMFCEQGKGVGKNIQQAISWYEKSADQNEIDAIKRLAEIYEQGIGVEKDPQKASYWRKKYNEHPLSKTGY